MRHFDASKTTKGIGDNQHDRSVDYQHSTKDIAGFVMVNPDIMSELKQPQMTLTRGNICLKADRLP